MAKNKKETAQSKISGQKANPVILLFLLLSGSCGLVNEILWMKMLALGSFLAGRFSDRIENPLRTYGLLEGGIDIYALLLPLLVAGTQPLFRFVYQGIDPSFYTFGLLRFFVCGILLLVPTTLMGPPCR